MDGQVLLEKLSEAGGSRSQFVAKAGSQFLAKAGGGGGHHERIREGVWSRSCLDSQRCTCSRPAQRTCRSLAVGVAPGTGSLGTESILFVASFVAGASLLVAIKSPTSSLAGGSALVSYSSLTWTVENCRVNCRKQGAVGVSLFPSQMGGAS